MGSFHSPSPQSQLYEEGYAEGDLASQNSCAGRQQWMLRT